MRQYMDELFHEVPVNRQSVEVKEEILQNITDKYHDQRENPRKQLTTSQLPASGI